MRFSNPRGARPATPEGATPTDSISVADDLTATLTVGAFDPATLALTLWVRAGDYDGSTTWTGTASAGTSGSHNLSAVRPTNGASLDGHTTVAFDGSDNQRFNGAAISTYVSDSAWSLWCLINVTSESTNSATPYNNAAIANDITGGYWGVFVKSGGGTPKVTAYQFHAGNVSIDETFTNGVWQLLQARYNGTNLEVRTNNGVWQPQAAGTIDNVAGTFCAGLSYGSVGLTCSMADLAVANTRFSDSDFTKIYTYAKARYPSAGLP